MIGRFLRPPHLTVSFDDRPYELGDALDFTVEIDAPYGLTVREGRADLLWVEEYIFSGTNKIVDPRIISRITSYGDRSLMRVGASFSQEMTNITITNRLTFEHPQDSRVFASRARLSPGSHTYKESLRLSSRLPALEQGAILTCRLIARLDVALGRNARVEKQIRVKVPRLP